MTIEQTGVIDMIVDEADKGIASLVIADHLEWGKAQPDHLLLLQEKLNTYISFYESGEVFEGRAHLRNRRLGIKVIGLHPPSGEAEEFLRRAAKASEGIGLGIEFELKEDKLEG